MTMESCVFDSINRELRTVPAFFSVAKVYTGFTRAQGVDVGVDIAPGQVLGSLHWEDGSSELLVAPDGCHGRIARFGAIAKHRIHRRPSQVILLLG